MDGIQSKVILIKSVIPNYLPDRQKLRSLFCDTLPNDKLHVNLLMSAYDENIVDSLGRSSDATLSALKCIKILIDTYGVSDNNAFWAVQTWCYLLGLNDIAEIICLGNGTSSSNSNSVSSGVISSSDQPIDVTHGIFMAGLDFPAGTVRLKVKSLAKGSQRDGVYYAILKKGSASNTIVTNGFIKSQAILTINEGQRLETGAQGEIELTSVQDKT